MDLRHVQLMSSIVVSAWTVLIVSDEESLITPLRMDSNSTIQELKTQYLLAIGDVHECDFLSVDRQTVYENFMTLEMISESVARSGIVTLRVRILDATTPKLVMTLFVCFGANCEEISVTPNDVLRNVLPGVPCRTFEYNGRPLNLNDTVQRAGLTDKALIAESRQKVTIRLTGGATRSFVLPPDAMVSQLKEQLSPFEDGEFSLWYSERELMPHDIVMGLNQIVEVARTRFTVHLGGRTVVWRTSSGMIKFGEFITQLASRCGMPEQQLETFTFSCVRCSRRISKAEEDFQLVQVKCCREESLTLKAETPTV